MKGLQISWPFRQAICRLRNLTFCRGPCPHLCVREWGRCSLHHPGLVDSRAACPDSHIRTNNVPPSYSLCSSSCILPASDAAFPTTRTQQVAALTIHIRFFLSSSHHCDKIHSKGRLVKEEFTLAQVEGTDPHTSESGSHCGCRNVNGRPHFIQSESRERHMLVLTSRSLFYVVQHLSHAIVPPHSQI